MDLSGPPSSRERLVVRAPLLLRVTRRGRCVSIAPASSAMDVEGRPLRDLLPDSGARLLDLLSSADRTLRFAEVVEHGVRLAALATATSRGEVVLVLSPVAVRSRDGLEPVAGAANDTLERVDGALAMLEAAATKPSLGVVELVRLLGAFANELGRAREAADALSQAAEARLARRA
jgi:hypothetical protein